jgi:hypothetical protein
MHGFRCCYEIRVRNARQSSPEGANQLSPARQRWEKAIQTIQVPEGRPPIAQRFNAGKSSAPSISRRDTPRFNDFTASARVPCRAPLKPKNGLNGPPATRPPLIRLTAWLSLESIQPGLARSRQQVAKRGIVEQAIE